MIINMIIRTKEIGLVSQYVVNVIYKIDAVLDEKLGLKVGSIIGKER